MAEQEKTRVWTYSLTGLLLIAVIFLAVWSELWYRVVVLASLVALFAFLIIKSKRLEKKFVEFEQIHQSAEEVATQEQMKLEKTKEYDLKALEEKEFQLQKLDLDRTQLFEELLSKTELEEMEKKTIRERLQQTETETSKVRQEWLNASSRLMSMMRGTKKFFIRDSPMKEMAASMDQDVLESGSFAALNNEIQRLLPRLSKESADLLAKSSYIDEENQLTRSGYKALLQASEEEK